MFTLSGYVIGSAADLLKSMRGSGLIMLLLLTRANCHFMTMFFCTRVVK